MDRTCITRHPTLDTNVVILEASDLRFIRQGAYDVGGLLCSGGVLVIDRLEWSQILSLRSAMENRTRKFDDPFSVTPTPSEPYAITCREIDAVLHKLYADQFHTLEMRASWRPAISSNEPLHFDSFRRSDTYTITAYLNVSTKPRKYGISITYFDLPSDAPPIDEAAHYTTLLRADAQKGIGPLGVTARRHYVSFAPGAIWIFDPRLVAHELLYGDGAICRSWLAKTMNRRSV